MIYALCVSVTISTLITILGVIYNLKERSKVEIDMYRDYLHECKMDLAELRGKVLGVKGFDEYNEKRGKSDGNTNQKK